MSRTMWEIELSHDGLNKYRHIRGTDKYVVEQKAAAQRRTWDAMWEKKLVAQEKEDKKELAADKTSEAQGILTTIENTLHHTLDIDDTVNWDSFLDNSSFPKKKPSKEKLPPPNIGFWGFIIPSIKRKKIAEWESKKQKNDQQYKEALSHWEKEKEKFLDNQKARNQRIAEQKEAYFQRKTNSIIDYCEMVLSNSEYPETFPQDYDIDYNELNKILIVDYALPSPSDVPNLKEVKYIKSRDEFKESLLSASAFNEMYDSLLYKIALRSLHELYEADVINAIDSIVFNGWVNSIDKATGKEVNACIITVQASKEEFLEINLEHVDPKVCFKNLKGIGSSTLHALTPVAPILKIDREDTRFVSAYDVADELDSSVNLAAMDWQDFENLIRELFEKEFIQSGGEVKVTQASRDGGVDAIAFDPDPIRGGKIVIQAKRYTNVVGVAAVRDLYGTIMNEGATKGILVTTADYGHDAYDFAKGKPITLLNGGNLLHLLNKHGHKAKIDLKEAKQILSEIAN